jgi:hypothetical protein
MEAGKKRKGAPGFTPSSSEGSASKKLKLLVRRPLAHRVFLVSPRRQAARSCVRRCDVGVRGGGGGCLKRRKVVDLRGSPVTSTGPNPLEHLRHTPRLRPGNLAISASTATFAACKLTACACTQNSNHTGAPRSKVQEVGYRLLNQLKNSRDKAYVPLRRPPRSRLTD